MASVFSGKPIQKKLIIIVRYKPKGLAPFMTDPPPGISATLQRLPTYIWLNADPSIQMSAKISKFSELLRIF